jgi:glycerate kinase
MPPRIVLAPDKFKGSLTADEAAAAMRAGVRDAVLDAVVVDIPVSDGGEGMLALVQRLGGTVHRCRVVGPMGAAVDARWVSHGGTAYIESAEACGLAHVPRVGPASALAATSYGVGELVRHALDTGHRRICLGLGGSASTDGGAGMLQALGVRVLDDDGCEVGRGGGALVAVARVDATGLDARLDGVEVTVAHDVDNLLNGEDGAAAVYAPQKGADPAAVAILDQGLTRFADAVEAAVGHAQAARPGAGAAGGLGFAATAVLGATPLSGAWVMLELVGARETLLGSDLLLVGEGSLDRQTLHGKAPAALARLGAELCVPCVALAGSVRVGPADLAAAGILGAYSLTEAAGDAARAMAEAGPVLRSVTATAVADWLER